MTYREAAERIRERADIVEVISSYIPLRPAGRNYKALCPFHKEKTPSFVVSPEKQLFHCFGCGAGGNVFTFVMRYEGVGFPEAVKILAERYGIEIEKGEERPDRLKPYYDLNRLAYEFFRSKLLHPREGKVARDYLLSRGISPRLWEVYGLGYAPDEWEALRGHLESRGADLLLAEELGLVVRGERGLYDRFRHRVIFPIEDLRGRTLGFGGRVIGEGEPKYLNSPDSPIYHKGEGLYGIRQARDYIIGKKEALVVEGYFDVLSLAQREVRNVVAPLGTALTVPQLRMLKPLCQRVVFLFDGDEAGRKAAMRAVELAVEEGIEAEVVLLPEGEDPDSFVRTKGEGGLLQRRMRGVDFYCQQVLQNYDLSDPEGRYRAVEALAGFLERVEDPLRRKIYTEYVASFVGIEPALLSMRPKGRPLVPMARKALTSSAEEALLALVIKRPEALSWIEESGVLEEFASDALKEVLREALKMRQEQRDPSLEIPVLLQEKGVGEGVFAFLFFDQEENPRRVFEDCLRRIRLRALRAKRERLLEEIRKAEVAGDEERLRALLAEQQSFLREQKALLEGLGIIKVGGVGNGG